MSVTKLVDDDTRADFIQKSNQIAYYFLDLYLADAKEASTARSPATEQEKPSTISESAYVAHAPPEPAVLVSLCHFRLHRLRYLSLLNCRISNL